MTNLTNLLRHIKYSGVANFRDAEVHDVVNDSRHVHPGDVFVAIRGAKDDGARYIGQAVARGAVAVVSESPLDVPGDVTLIVVEDARAALSTMAAEIYGQPSRILKVIGVTGTNGKTSTTLLVRSILKEAGIRCGLLGTISYDLGACTVPAPVTTPESCDIQGYMAQMLLSGMTHVVMEVSSHSLSQGRVRDVDFDAAVFTNLTSEHMDYHGDFEKYFEAKAKLFRMLKPEAHAVINADGPFGRRMAEETRAPVTWYGLEKKADVTARVRKVDMSGSRYTLFLDKKSIPVRSALPGRHNIMNSLAAAAACWRLGIAEEHIAAGIEAVASVPGRLERVEAGQPFEVLVDFAHTEDALNTVLACVRPLVRGRLISVFGCGGDRDRTKRAPMAAAAERWSDFVVVTSDNPRAEDPQKIIGEIVAGFSKKANYLVEPDRAAAIQAAVRMAKKGDLVLIAGKGHETAQKFADGEIPFDDRTVALAALNGLKGQGRAVRRTAEAAAAET